MNLTITPIKFEVKSKVEQKEYSCFLSKETASSTKYNITFQKNMNLDAIAVTLSRLFQDKDLSMSTVEFSFMNQNIHLSWECTEKGIHPITSVLTEIAKQLNNAQDS